MTILGKRRWPRMLAWWGVVAALVLAGCFPVIPAH